MESSPKPGSPEPRSPDPGSSPNQAQKKQKLHFTDTDPALIILYSDDATVHQALGIAGSPAPQGATAQQSAQNLKHFIFCEISQFIELDLCGVPHHPTAAAATGDQYCQEVLHHLTGRQFFKIKGI